MVVRGFFLFMADTCCDRSYQTQPSLFLRRRTHRCK